MDSAARARPPADLHLRCHIANVLRSQGRFAEARELDTDVLERQRAVLGPDHPHTLMTAGGLARRPARARRVPAGAELDQETYDSFKEQFGEDHPRTLTAANNLAVVAAPGRRLLRRARDRPGDPCTGAMRCSGADHPYTLYSAANLARDLREAGASGSRSTCSAAPTSSYRAVLGDDISDTLRTAKSLAVSLRKAGRQTRPWP